MKIYAINGSPRKNKNTETLLQKALDGAKEAALAKGIAEKDIETEMIHLYDYQYTGCKSCFTCKRLGSLSYGKCAIRDDIYELLDKCSQADALIFGSPVYFADISGQMKSFLERLLFQYFVYDMDYSSIAPKKMKTAFIYSMNVPEAAMKELDYLSVLTKMHFFIEKVFTKPEVLYACDTYQFDDYSKYKVECFNEVDKAKARDTLFPAYCQNAFDIGAKLVR